MFTNVLLTIILLILIVELYIIFFIIRFTRSFLEEIRGVKGFQFNSLQIGDDAPLFRAIDSNRETIILKDEFMKNNVLMLFVNTNCSTCKGLIQDISKANVKYPISFLLINNDTSNNDNEFVKMLSNNVSYIKSTQIFSSYHINLTPYFVLINTNGKIDSLGEITNFQQIQNILSEYSKAAS